MNDFLLLIIYTVTDYTESLTFMELDTCMKMQMSTMVLMTSVIWITMFQGLHCYVNTLSFNEVKMTWNGARDTCQYENKTLVFMPLGTLKFVAVNMNEILQPFQKSLSSGISFWTIHRTSTHSKNVRFYSENFTMEATRTNQQPLLCIFAISEADNEQFGWEATECDDDIEKHYSFCETLPSYEQAHKWSYVLYEEKATMNLAKEECLRVGGHLLGDFKPEFGGYIFFSFFYYTLWSKTAVTTVLTPVKSKEYAKGTPYTMFPEQTDETLKSNNCIYVQFPSRSYPHSSIEWVTEPCDSTDRSFICKLKNDKYYLLRRQNIYEGGRSLGTDSNFTPYECSLKCLELRKIGYPCTLFNYYVAESTCSYLAIGDLERMVEERDGWDNYEIIFVTPLLGTMLSSAQSYPAKSEEVTQEGFILAVLEGVVALVVSSFALYQIVTRMLGSYQIRIKSTGVPSKDNEDFLEDNIQIGIENTVEAVTGKPEHNQKFGSSVNIAPISYKERLISRVLKKTSSKYFDGIVDENPVMYKSNNVIVLPIAYKNISDYK